MLSDDNSVADLIIEDPVEDGMASLGNSGPYGRAEDGKLYEYIVKDSVEGLPVDLVDGGKPLTRVLGGNPTNDVFMVGSAPAVAFSGINTLFAAALSVLPGCEALRAAQPARADPAVAASETWPPAARA